MGRKEQRGLEGSIKKVGRTPPYSSLFLKLFASVRLILPGPVWLWRPALLEAYCPWVGVESLC